VPIGEPGEVLREEFLAPLDVTQVKLARHIGIPVHRIGEIILGRRAVTPETAWLLSDALGATVQFWLNLQMNHDLVAQRPTRRVRRLRK